MATGIWSWSQTAANNATADSTINFAEGQAPSTLNDSCRAEMAILAKWRDDLAGVSTSNSILTTAGTANAKTLTTNGSIAALTNGWTVTFKVDVVNTTACTLAVDGLAAKNIQRISGTNLIGGELKAGSVYTVTYHQPADAWILHSAGSDNFPSGTSMVFWDATAPSGWTADAQNNKALRVVSSGTTGGTAGGTTAFSSVFTSRTIAQANLPAASLSHSLSVGTSITNGTLVGRNIGSATWPATAGGHSVVESISFTESTLSLASGTVSGTVSLGGSGTAMDFAVQYCDVIIATKD